MMAAQPQSGVVPEFELASPPADGVSSVTFGPGRSSFLLVTSWDKTARLYDASTNALRETFAQHKAPVLDGCFPDPTHGCTGGVDGDLLLFDFNTSAHTTLGSHSAAVRCVKHDTATDLVLSGSWDKSIKLWDFRQRACVGTYEQPDKVYAVSCANGKAVVGTAGRHVTIWDLRNMGFPMQKRESSLKFQTRSVACTPNGQGYVMGSVEGRVAVEYFDTTAEVQKKKYAFKCHRQTVDGQATIFPVNAIAFHPVHGTFATGGGDGTVNVWDGHNKKRLCQLRQYPSSIASLAFSGDGRLLAIAASYTYEQGEKEHPADAIFVRGLADVECTPK